MMGCAVGFEGSMLTVPRETGCWKTGSVRGLEERICQRMETFFNLRILVKALLCALYPARTSGCVPLGTYAARSWFSYLDAMASTSFGEIAGRPRNAPRLRVNIVAGSPPDVVTGTGGCFVPSHL